MGAWPWEEGETKILFLFPIFLLSALLHGANERAGISQSPSARTNDLEVTFCTVALLKLPSSSAARFIPRNSS